MAEEITDIHSHILPGIDDGAASWEEALKLLEAAKRQRITRVIATPHYSGRYPGSTPERIAALCRDLQEKASKAGISVEILPGQEVFYSDRVPELLAEGKLMTLAGSRYILTEFLPGAPYSEMYRGMRRILQEGFCPVLAHMERYRALREAGRAEELRDAGVYMQMNFRPVGNPWYESTARWCRKMLREGMVDFMGTDMHNLRERSPDTGDACRWMESHLDRSYMYRLIRENGNQICNNEKVYQ